MFGYVRPFKPEMKINEFDTYKGVYCGLCKQLGRDYGFFMRMTLNYDFAFLAVLSLGVHDCNVPFRREACVAHPLSRKPCLSACADLSYVAACAVMIIFYKWQDNIADSGFLKGVFFRILRPYFSHARKKALRRFPQLDDIMQKTLAGQQETERLPNCSLDMAAEASSRALALLFEDLSEDPAQRKVLHRLGFLLGRWVYLMDAVDDLEDDAATGSFNPLLSWSSTDAAGDSEPRKQIRIRAEGALNMTHGELALAYELVELNRYKSILDNIIYLGLPAVKRQVMQGRRKKSDDRSL